MRILVCNERFLFRFGVDRCLLMLADEWRQAGHEVILMGERMDAATVEKCADRFIQLPPMKDYLHGNDETLNTLKTRWNQWFEESAKPDLALVAGWPFYASIAFLRTKCGCVVFNDYGAVPMEGFSGGALEVQRMLRELRRQNLPEASRIIAISHFLEDTQSKPEASGRVPTATVHCGVDHIVRQLWVDQEIQPDSGADQSRIIAEIRKLKSEGNKIIFQPGRWETENYKNSDGSVELSRYLTKKGISHRILLLGKVEDLAGVPEEIRENFVPLGFIDDKTMRQAMELSDVGISPTTWEGFDLPLGEMQYLGRPMFVLRVGAHPEVVCHPAFLCRNMQEMSRKVANLLQGRLPVSPEVLAQAQEVFRKKFTWTHCAEGMLREFEQALLDSRVLFIDATNACHDPANSGVMRVTRKLGRGLQSRLRTIFVLWDESIGRFVLPYPEEVRTLGTYGGPQAEKIDQISIPGQERKRMESLLPEIGAARKMFLFTETVRYTTMEKAIPWLHRQGIGIACIFYDAIPVLHPEYCSPAVSANHSRYMECLADVELVLPIEAHDGMDLASFWKQREIQPHAVIGDAELAAEIDGTPRNTVRFSSLPRKKQILFVSTLEPRKNHLRFLEALGNLFENEPQIAENTIVHLVGNRYAGNEEIPAAVEQFCSKYHNASWLGVVDDQRLKEEYDACTFTVYPSVIEGFGMPIIESLWAGKPCLCSREGSIGQLATPGGCLLTDVTEVAPLESALHRMLTEEDLLLRLQREAVERRIKTWEEYFQEVEAQMTAMKLEEGKREKSIIPRSVRREIKEELKNWQGIRLILVSNHYPPDNIGGAEIIAHNQLKTMRADRLARGVVFTLDLRGRNPEGTLEIEHFEDVPVIRLSVEGNSTDQNEISFYHREVEEAFREICSLVQPDAVHCHNMIGTSLGIIAIAKQMDARVMITLHDNWGFCYKNTMLDNRGAICENILRCRECRAYFGNANHRIPAGVRQDYLRRNLEKADLFISPSAYLSDMYVRAGFDARKTRVIWNGCDTRRFARIERKSSEKIRVTFAGYFGRHKGIATLIQAMAGLKGRMRLNLVGTGEEESHYRELAQNLGVAEQISFWGKIPNEEIEKVYAETDIYCLPSIWPENQPVSITEAMACGIPVVASKLGGSQELVEDGVTGFLFEAGNADVLREKLQQLIEDPALRESMGRAGQQRMAANDYHEQVQKLASLYRMPISKTRRLERRLILIKGTRYPAALDQYIGADVLPWDWMMEDDVKQATGAVLLEGESLTNAERELLRHKKLKLLVPSDQKKEYEQDGIRTVSWCDREELIQKLIRL